MSQKPKPTQLRIIEGNRGHRPIPNNPQPKLVYEKPPKWLDREGRREWRRRGKELYNLGILTELDLSAFGAYCYWYSEFVQATDKSYKKEAGHQMRMFMVEFGMTPSSRTKIHVQEKDDEGGMRELLRTATYT